MVTDEVQCDWCLTFLCADDRCLGVDHVAYYGSYLGIVVFC